MSAAAREVSHLAGTAGQLVAAVTGSSPTGASVPIVGGTVTLLPGDEMSARFSDFVGMVLALEADRRVRTLRLSITLGLLTAIERHNIRLAVLAGVPRFTVCTAYVQVLEVKLLPGLSYKVRLYDANREEMCADALRRLR